METQAQYLYLSNPKEVQHGRGRIVYENYPHRGLPGWQLPGGSVTTDESVALHAAQWIDQYTANWYSR